MPNPTVPAIPESMYYLKVSKVSWEVGRNSKLVQVFALGKRHPSLSAGWKVTVDCSVKPMGGISAAPVANIRMSANVMQISFSTPSSLDVMK